MKKTLLIILIYSLCLTNCLTNSKLAYSENYYYTQNVDHLFTHCLIAYPQNAFSDKNSMKKYLSNDCITSQEFKKVLISLHKNNYILVSINDCFEIKNNNATKKYVKVPVGKKPIILSFDDVNYDSKKIGTGMVDKIILDDLGNIGTSTLINGQEIISYDKEFVNILENFIEENPDFSPFGAKGCINLTGYDGILGYRTSHTNTKNREYEIEKAKKVVEKLKGLNWDFASHSYGHYHMKKISREKFKKELDLWKNEVETIVGKTGVYVYPYGEWEVYQNEELSEKHKLLSEYGFHLFCGVGMQTFYSYLPTKCQSKVLFMDRKCVDGYTLTSNSKYLAPFFNSLEILDNLRK